MVKFLLFLVIFYKINKENYIEFLMQIENGKIPFII